VRQVLDEIDAEEFAEWQAFDVLEPIGGNADDYRAGIVASMLANIHRKRGTEAIKPLELFPWHIEPRDPTKDSLAIKAAMARLAGRGKNG
jgi:hypothetical protein